MELYYNPRSAPCRAVLMTAQAVGVNLTLKITDPLKDKNLAPELCKVNPQHTVPTLVDNGFVLWQSHAIMIYLVEKYDNKGTLYSNCPQKRAVINQRLFFDMGTLYQRFMEFYYPQLLAKQPPNLNILRKIEEAFGFLDQFLNESQYVAGDSLTIADLALLATVSSYDVAKFEITKYINVTRWYKNCKTCAPGWKLNENGMEYFKKFFETNEFN